MNQHPATDGYSLRTVVVPTDFSEPSFSALRYAAGLARATGAALHVVHVAEIDFAVPGAALPGRNPLVDDTEAARALQGQLKALTGPSVVPEFHGRTGRAFDQIVRFAREQNADLIVMSSHGATGIRRLVFGSNAQRVVQHSSTPVLVVRADRSDPQLGAELRLRTILVPVDFSASSEEALRAAVAFAQKFDARLVLLHAVVAPVVAGAAGYTVPMLDVPVEQLCSAAEEQMRALVESVDFKGVAHESQITTGFPGEAIGAYADRRGVDLIIMSTHGRTGLMHVLIGSVAEHVVWHALSPVLVVPGRVRE